MPALGAAAAAVASSACCWLPLGALAFGASAAGASAFFERWRPYFAAAAIALLGVGFYSAYFGRCACSADGCGEARAGRRRRLARGMLWASAAVVAVFVTFPKYAGGLIAALDRADARPVTSRAAPAWRFAVEGMTCEVCAATLQSDLAGIDGVQSATVDYATRSALVRADDPGIVDAVRRTAERHGYTATPETEKKGPTP
ncbi:MAG: heavy-metal-associated domain-containing protein [Planctomycetota bacterium]|nr:MAG: heavy-metal-associated domain-containing protein [Planctomycetota bacterium]